MNSSTESNSNPKKDSPENNEVASHPLKLSDNCDEIEEEHHGGDMSPKTNRHQKITNGLSFGGCKQTFSIRREIIMF